MLYWIWLSTLQYVSPILQKQLLKEFKTPRHVFEAGKADLGKVEGMTKYALESIVENRSLASAKEILGMVKSKDIRMLFLDDPRYPPHVRENAESPIVLYYYGTLPVLDESVAIIGLKECTDYGKQIAIDLTTKLCGFGVPVICNLESGTGYYVQQTCINKNGLALAFTAYGLDLCNLKKDKMRFEKLVEHGAVISPFPPLTVPKNSHYQGRNALISTWAKHIVIIEAEDQGESLSIAQFARKLGRKLYAVPNQINIKSARGTNTLLAEGATPYVGIESLKITRGGHPYGDIREFWAWTKEQNQKEILFFLSQSPLPLSILAPRLNTDKYTLLDQLTTMEREGKVHIRGGMVYKI